MNDKSIIAKDQYVKANSFYNSAFSNINADIQQQVTRAKRLLLASKAEEVALPFVTAEFLAEVVSTISSGDWKVTQFVADESFRLDDDQAVKFWCYRFLYDYFPANRLVAPVPPCIQIEPTSICNYRCTFCYQIDESFTRKGSKHMGSMELSVFREVVDQIEKKVGFLTLASRGEPTVARQLPEMLAYCKGKFSNIKLNTNASLLNDHLSIAILDTVDTLVISADAADEELYAELRVGGKLSKVISKIRRFNELRSSHPRGQKIISRVSGVYVRSEQDIDALVSFWRESVDQVTFVKYNPWDNIYNNPRNGISEPCSDLYRRLFVWFDGTINPCDSDYKSALALGTVNDKSILEWWHDPSLNQLRSQHLSGSRQSIHPCNRCNVV